MTTIDISGSVTINFDAEISSGSEPMPPSIHATADPTLSAGGNGVTFFNTGLQLVAGRFVKSFGVYSSAAFSGIVKVGERNSAQDWDVKPERALTFSHPGGGWADFDLPAIWTVPSSPPAGAFFLGVYSASGTYERTSATRSYKAGNVSGNGQSGFTVDTGAAPAVRYSYYDAMPASGNGGGTAELNWSVPAQEHPGIDSGVISAVIGSVTQTPNHAGMSVDFIDVCRSDWGGDATLIIAPNGEAVLVDTGAPTIAAASVIPHLKRRGVTSLKALFITHQHVDHIGGASELMDRFPVEALYVPVVPSGNFANFDQIMWNNMIAKANAKGIPVTVVSTADTPAGTPRLTFGGVKVYVMQAYEMTFRVEWEQSTILLLADAAETQLNALIASSWDLSADIIKNPHHGAGDGNFYTKLADFPTTIHVGNFPPRLTAQASVQAEAAAINSAGRGYYTAAWHGTISAKFSSDGTKQVSTYFTDYLFSQHHGRHLSEIYGPVSPGIYIDPWVV